MFITALCGLAGGLVGTLLYQWLVGHELDWVRGVFVGSAIGAVMAARKFQRSR
ncbi:MAG: hypothetical protein JNK87_17720 [Bryobacterales bacterium]|nr:hypothetical protein [Bryobacterales bacterium]